jgi:hypothetical protein
MIKKIREILLNESYIVGLGLLMISLKISQGDIQRATLVGVMTIILNGIRQKLQDHYIFTEHYKYGCQCEEDNK